MAKPQVRSHGTGENGPVAVITGAASGIGRATTLELARRGHRVGLLDRDSTQADTVAREVAGEYGIEAHAVACDVTRWAEVSSAVAEVVTALGEPSAGVACAGIEILGEVEDLEDGQWAAAMDVNAGGVFRLAKALMPYLKKNRGAFVAVSSDAGVSGAQGYAAYVASKHAVIGLIRSLALDHGADGVRSNAVCPGFVETPMAARIMADSPPEEVDFYRSIVPMGRFARPAEVANVIAHLVGPDASYTNGLVYNIDGGSTAGYFVPAGDGR